MKDEEKKASETEEVIVKDEEEAEVPAEQVVEKSDAEKEQVPAEKSKWVQLRMIPIIVRVILVILLLIIVAIIGLIIGYSYMGGGDSGDVLKKETWTHIVDIIKGIE